MKKILPLLVVACVGLAAVGCDPGSKAEPSASTDAVKSSAPTPATSSTDAKPAK